MADDQEQISWYVESTELSFNKYTGFWIAVNSLVPLAGVLFFQWGLAEVVFLFWYEMFLIGAVAALSMLLALGGRGFFHDIFSRLFWTAGFVVLYLGLLMLLVSFTLVNLDFNTLFDRFRGFGISPVILAINYGLNLLGFIYFGKFRVVHYFQVLFEAMIYALPITCILVLLIFPNIDMIPLIGANKAIVVGIILARLAVELVIHFGKRWLVKKSLKQESNRG